MELSRVANSDDAGTAGHFGGAYVFFLNLEPHRVAGQSSHAAELVYKGLEGSVFRKLHRLS